MRGCRKETQWRLHMLCSRESQGSSRGLASSSAAGGQLRLVIPSTAIAGFDKAALAALCLLSYHLTR